MWMVSSIYFSPFGLTLQGHHGPETFIDPTLDQRGINPDILIGPTVDHRGINPNTLIGPTLDHGTPTTGRREIEPFGRHAQGWCAIGQQDREPKDMF